MAVLEAERIEQPVKSQPRSISPLWPLAVVLIACWVMVIFGVKMATDVGTALMIGGTTGAFSAVMWVWRLSIVNQNASGFTDRELVQVAIAHIQAAERADEANHSWHHQQAESALRALSFRPISPVVRPPN